jgi:NAD(P)-dependent dehydrogenase (short-subunit alcohol dehydrogenase family)
MKKIMVIGASGTLGQAVVQELRADHEIVEASRGDHRFPVDFSNEESVRALFNKAGQLDGIIVAAGEAHIGPLKEMTAEQFNKGLQNKLLGQVRVYLIGQHHLSAGGSITLTTGIITDEPLRDCANVTAVDSALEGFVRAAATENREIRINAVSPTMLTESADIYAAYCPGFEGVPASRAALAFRRSVDGIQTGRVYRVW